MKMLKGKKGDGEFQAEYLLMVALVIFAIIVPASYYVSNQRLMLALQQGQTAANTIAAASDSVINTGDARCVAVEVPTDVTAFGAANNEVYMKIVKGDKINEIHAKTSISLVGVMPTNSGLVTICITNNAGTGNNHAAVKGATCSEGDGCFSFCDSNPDPDCGGSDGLGLSYGSEAGSRCGDGLIDQGREACEVGTLCANPGMICNLKCECVIGEKQFECGNGVTQAGEACDGRACSWTSASCPADSPATSSSCKPDCTCDKPSPVYSCGDGIAPQGGFGTANSCGVIEECEKREECPGFIAGDLGVSCVNCKCISSPLLCGDSAAPACGGVCPFTGEICKDNGNGACQCVPGCGGDTDTCNGDCKEQDEVCRARTNDDGQRACACVKVGSPPQYIAGMIGGPCIGGDLNTCGGSCNEGVCLPDPGTQSCVCS